MIMLVVLHKTVFNMTDTQIITMSPSLYVCVCGCVSVHVYFERNSCSYIFFCCKQIGSTLHKTANFYCEENVHGTVKVAYINTAETMKTII
jgi:hypothetical protein